MLPAEQSFRVMQIQDWNVGVANIIWHPIHCSYYRKSLTVACVSCVYLNIVPASKIKVTKNWRVKSLLIIFVAANWSVGRAVRLRSAKPATAVRIRQAPLLFLLLLRALEPSYYQHHSTYHQNKRQERLYKNNCLLVNKDF